jgi:transposase
LLSSLSFIIKLSYFTIEIHIYISNGIAILDNNSTHKDKLHRYLSAELFTSGIEEQITVKFVYTPPYSPNFNLVEYLIHLLRVRLPHHWPSDKSIEQVEMRIKTFFETQKLQTPIQIANTIQHIYNLIL